MMEDRVETRISLVDATASPDALGSMLLGWITILLALSALGYYPMGGMVLLTVFFSGFGFLLVAYIGYKRGEAFTLFAFGAIAVFAFSFSVFNILPGAGIIAAPTGAEIGTFMIVFAMIAGIYTLITMKMPCRLLSLTIFSASVLFLMMGIHSLIGGDALIQIAGIWAIAVAAMAIYLGSATAYNTVVGRMALPIWLCDSKDSKR